MKKTFSKRHISFSLSFSPSLFFLLLPSLQRWFAWWCTQRVKRTTKKITPKNTDKQRTQNIICLQKIQRMHRLRRGAVAVHTGMCEQAAGDDGFRLVSECFEHINWCGWRGLRRLMTTSKVFESKVMRCECGQAIDWHFLVHFISLPYYFTKRVKIVVRFGQKMYLFIGLDLDDVLAACNLFLIHWYFILFAYLIRNFIPESTWIAPSDFFKYEQVFFLLHFHLWLFAVRSFRLIIRCCGASIWRIIFIICTVDAVASRLCRHSPSPTSPRYYYCHFHFFRMRQRKTKRNGLSERFYYD